MKLGYTTDTLEIICASCAYDNYYSGEIAHMAKENAPVRPDDICETCGEMLSIKAHSSGSVETFMYDSPEMADIWFEA